MLFFIDESGNDHHESPYEILAGIAIKEQDLWNLILDIQDLEIDTFGLHLSDVGVEVKGKKLLKRKTFRLASQMPEIDEGERRMLCKEFVSSQ